jgi:hypothetical protein
MDLAQTPPRMIGRDFKELLSRYIRHPESKSLGPDGQPCTGRAVGLLQRAHVTIDKVVHIGKETPRGIEEGDEPSEIMKFEPIEYEKTPNPKGMEKPSEYLILRIKKIGIRKLMSAGCGRRILEKICRRELVRVSTLHEYEQMIREYESKGKTKMSTPCAQPYTWRMRCGVHSSRLIVDKPQQKGQTLVPVALWEYSGRATLFSYLDHSSTSRDRRYPTA